MRRDALALSPLLTLAACALPSFEIQPRYARAEISGSAGIASGGVGGSADVEQAGLEEEDVPAGRADLEFGSPHLIALVQAPRFEGSGTLDATISDGTNTIAAGTAIDSAVEVGSYDAALVFDLVPGDTVEVALGIGVALLDLSMQFEDTGSGTTVETEEQVPVPLLAGAASVWIGPLEAVAFVGGLQYEYDQDSITYLDADVFGRLRILGGDERLRGSLVVGYRLTDFELEYEDDSSDIDADLTVQGPYVGLELSL